MDNFVRRWISSPRKKIAKFASVGSVMADIGCGPGYFTIPMAELAGPTGKVYAADADPKSINVLKEKTSTHGLQNILEAYITSAADMKFIPGHSVDFVFANGVLCCMVDHDGAIAEIKRILKPSGLCYLSVATLFRKSDIRAVPKSEWEQILEGFEVKETHDGILNRWATVRLKNQGV
jgi:ubiquinone/menaquinone biosynthesis C-methylase UbiE